MLRLNQSENYLFLPSLEPVQLLDQLNLATQVAKQKSQCTKPKEKSHHYCKHNFEITSLKGHQKSAPTLCSQGQQ
jgi:hypothetical protein